jgi:3-methyladenine DNA glycosylase AlkD
VDSQKILQKLKSLANSKNVEGMARFGINPENTLGVSVTTIRALGKEIKKEVQDKNLLHRLSLRLWDSGIHEARLLATIIDSVELVTERQLDDWVRDIDSWDVCDGFCMNLVDKTSFAYVKAKEWASSDEQFVRRAGFATMAGLAIHDKTASDEDLEEFFPLIKKYSKDPRNFVRKAVSWALRQIGKRNPYLLTRAISLAEEIEKLDSKSSRWIARDALKELRSRL